MFDQFLQKAGELVAAGESFAVAVVVRYEAPISSKPGNKAIIFSDGTMWGWIGGGCTQPVVIKEGLKALADGKPRLIRISPSASPEEGVVDYTMTCHSGGTVDVFIEPVLPKPQLLILGRSPVAQTLSKLAKAINYGVSVAAPGAESEKFPDANLVRIDLDLRDIKITASAFIVVSTQGECDEEALEQALASPAAYVAFVASKNKAQKIFEYLREEGIAADKLNKVRVPAGLDIHANTPEEIAVSILAEIIQVKGSRATVSPAKTAMAAPKQEGKDPICGMSIDIGAARYKSEFRGNLFYFCCAGCKQTFDKQPDRYALTAAR